MRDECAHTQGRKAMPFCERAADDHVSAAIEQGPIAVRPLEIGIRLVNEHDGARGRRHGDSFDSRLPESGVPSGCWDRSGRSPASRS
jgi:hypothetical protein